MSVVYTQSHNYSEIVTNKNPEMEPNISQLHLQQQQHCNNQNNSGLFRYRSAPSSLLTSLTDTTTNMDYVNEETFTTSEDDSSDMDTMLANLTNSQEFERKQMKQEIGDSFSKGILQQQHNHNNGYSYGISPPQIIYQQPQQIHSLSNSFDGSFYAMNLASENCNNLIRQKSSPAGFFSNHSVHNGCDISTTSTSGLHGTLNFSSKPSEIAKFEHESLQANCVENGNIGNNNGSTKSYMSSFTNDFWNGSTTSALKTTRNNGEIMFSTSNALETQDSDFGYQKIGLSHHLSLPSSSTKMTSMEKFLHIQGSTPCKIRAKRGFATHPRSIAERERRIRISSRIRKLQDLFPKSDKPSSTSDMLDLAVEYIKDLRKQVKTLTETKANCICGSNTQS